MFSRLTAFASLLAVISTARATIGPLAPDGSVVFKTGETCRIAWSPDTTNKWATMNIELMTGDNYDMVHITTVGTVDGTTTKEFEFPCPAVIPNSPVYFYQFSSPAEPDKLQWTTRFAIGDKDGKTTPPTNATQSDGAAIPWGTGALADPSTAKPPPSYLPSSSGVLSTDPSGSASGSVSVTGSSSASGSASASASGSASATGSASSGMVTKAVSTSSRAPAASASGASTNGTAAATDSGSGALGGHAVSLSAVVFGALVGAIGLAL